MNNKRSGQDGPATGWRDEGCESFPSCLNCPLPRCIEEEARGRRKLRLAVRDRKIAGLQDAGKDLKSIACLLDVSLRTVQRAVRRNRGVTNAA